MNKHILSIVTALTAVAVIYLVSTTQVSAQNCGPYGTACPPTDLTINKQVKHPITGDFVENLVESDTKNATPSAYSPGSEVIFNLRITNSSNRTFSSVSVTDTLPERMVNPKVDDASKNDVTDVKNPDTRTLFFVLAKELTSGETREVKIKATVVSEFPTDKTVFCGPGDKLENKATVKAEDRSDDDTASICVFTGKGKLPEAGVTDVLPLLPFIGTGITGIALFLKKRE